MRALVAVLLVVVGIMLGVGWQRAQLGECQAFEDGSLVCCIPGEMCDD
jgi:hypothetical protein